MKSCWIFELLLRVALGSLAGSKTMLRVVGLIELVLRQDAPEKIMGSKWKMDPFCPAI